MVGNEKTDRIEVGKGMELGVGGMDIVAVKDGKVLVHFGHGETEFEHWFRIGQSREIVFEDEDYYQRFTVKIVSIGRSNGKDVVEVLIEEK